MQTEGLCSFLFQSTPAHGGRLHLPCKPVRRNSFNPRPHTAGDIADHRRDDVFFWFQSTPAHGGRHAEQTMQKLLKGFNPRPHTAGDPGPNVVPVSVPGVSIHARTRRATSLPATNSLERAQVSIHARTRRATSIFEITCQTMMFQSTPAHGGRRFVFCHFARVAVFQSTPAHGGRPCETKRIN